ncbi:MAG: hypothetical protein ACO1OB_25860, partial [Archangium sp.]
MRRRLSCAGGRVKMQLSKSVVVAFTISALLGACTNTYIYDLRRDDQLPRDRTLTVEGEFCTPSPNEVVRPIKIVLAMDASQSMNVTDPNGSRAEAVLALLDSLPQEPEISFVVLLFAGSTSAWLSKSGDDEFDPSLCLGVFAPSGRLAGVAQCGTSAFVKDLAADPGPRRRGVGGCLLAAVFATFRARGA